VIAPATVVEGGSYTAAVSHAGGCESEEFFANMVFNCVGCTAQAADVQYTNIYRYTSNYAGSIPFSIANDALTEGPETFQIRIFRRGGEFLRASNLITIAASDPVTCSSSTSYYEFFEAGIPGGYYCPPQQWGIQAIAPGVCQWARVYGQVDDVLLIGNAFGTEFTAVDNTCPAGPRQYDYVFQPNGNFTIAAGDTRGGAASYNLYVVLSETNPLP